MVHLYNKVLGCYIKEWKRFLYASEEQSLRYTVQWKKPGAEKMKEI